MKKTSVYSQETVYYRLPTVLGDILIHYITFLVLLGTTLIPIQYTFPERVVSGPPYLLILSYIVTTLAIGIRLGDRSIHNSTVIYRAFLQTFITLCIFSFSVYAVYHIPPGWYIAVQFGIAGTLTAVWHMIIRSLISHIRRSGRNRLKVLMVGADENLVSIYFKMKGGYGLHGYRVFGFFTDAYKENVPDSAHLLGGMGDVLSYLDQHDVDELYCGVNPASNPALVNAIIRKCEQHFVTFYYVPNMNGYLHRRMHYSEFDDVTVIRLREEPLNNPVAKASKRLFDILASGLFLITIYPFVWVFAAIGIKLSSPGPILFRQKRTGYNGKAFDCLKFRSMKVNADSDKVQATEHDPRKTKFGDFLRKTSIDELPQFINVFKGDMSLVGPRPHMEYHTELYSQLISDYMVRHLLKPGITGWAQVNGCRGETKTVQDMKDRVEHDIWYIEHWSFALDFKILCMTVTQILGGDKQAY